MQPGRSLQLSSYRSDEVLGASAKRAAINLSHERGKRGNAVQTDVGHLDLFIHCGLTIQIATQRRDSRDDYESSSSSTVKMALSPRTEIATPLPQVTQLKRRSQSMCEWHKGRLDARYGTSSMNTLVGPADLIAKSRQLSRG